MHACKQFLKSLAELTVKRVIIYYPTLKRRKVRKSVFGVNDDRSTLVPAKGGCTLLYFILLIVPFV